MSKGKKILTAVLVPIMLICLACDMWLLWYELFLKDNFSLTTAYVDDMSYSEEEKFFIEVQYYPNMFEARINYYTDTQIPEYDETTQSYGGKYTFSSGVQFDGCYQAEVKTKKTGFLGLGNSYRYNDMQNCTYYNTDQNGTSYVAIAELADQDKWVYDIGGELVLLTAKGNLEYGGNYFFAKTGTRYQVYDMALALQDLYSAVESLEDGKRVVTFDMSEYFNFTMYDEETGRFEEEIHETKETWMFINIFVNKHSTDFVSAEQSIFGQFMGDTEWSLYDLSKADYWRARHEYNLTINDFTFVYSNNSYHLKLKQSVIDYLSEFDNMQYIVTIDLDNIYFCSEKIDIVGFTDKPFGSLGIDTINLTTEETREFEVFDKYNIVCPENLTITIGGAE